MNSQLSTMMMILYYSLVVIGYMKVIFTFEQITSCISMSFLARPYPCLFILPVYLCPIIDLGHMLEHK